MDLQGGCSTRAAPDKGGECRTLLIARERDVCGHDTGFLWDTSSREDRKRVRSAHDAAEKRKEVNHPPVFDGDRSGSYEERFIPPNCRPARQKPIRNRKGSAPANPSHSTINIPVHPAGDTGLSLRNLTSFFFTHPQIQGSGTFLTLQSAGLMLRETNPHHHGLNQFGSGSLPACKIRPGRMC
jgi:hypothetical protein